MVYLHRGTHRYSIPVTCYPASAHKGRADTYRCTARPAVMLLPDRALHAFPHHMYPALLLLCCCCPLGQTTCTAPPAQGPVPDGRPRRTPAGPCRPAAALSVRTHARTHRRTSRTLAPRKRIEPAHKRAASQRHSAASKSCAAMHRTRLAARAAVLMLSRVTIILMAWVYTVLACLPCLEPSFPGPLSTAVC